MTPRDRQVGSAPTGSLDGLTSLRFFAALMVILFHYFNQYMAGCRQYYFGSLICHGYSGVTFFFVISGFVLSHAYMKLDNKDGKAVAGYFKARVARIVPLYLLSLLVASPFYIDTLIHSQVGLYLTCYSMASVLAPLGLQAWIPGAAASINFPSWSVSDEVFFYLLFPLLLPLVRLRPGRWLVMVCLYTVTLWAATLWLWQSLGDGYGLMASVKSYPDSVRLAAQFIKFFPLCHVHEFIFGMLLYGMWFYRSWRWSAQVLLISGCSLLLILMNYADAVPPVIYHNGLLVLPFALLILGAANLKVGRGGLFIFLGKASYGMYLFHAPIYQIIRWFDDEFLRSSLASVRYLNEIIAIVLVLLIASWLHRAFEEPMQRWILRYDWRILYNKAPGHQRAEP